MLEAMFKFHFYALAIYAVGGRPLGVASGRLPTVNLKIILARESGSPSRDCAALLCAKPDFLPALRLIGSIEVTDYLDFLAIPDRLEDFLAGLLNFIVSSPDLPIKTLDLYNRDWKFPQPKRHYKQLAPKAPGTFTSQRLLPTPYIPFSREF